MTEKRFENRLNKDNIKFNTLNPVWDNEKGIGLNVFEMIDLMNELYEEKEYWKSSCCSQDSFNSILLNELNVAQEQGYSVSNPFKKLIGKVGDEYENLRKNNEELKEENMELKERNNRQYKQLNQLYHLIEEENWETLTNINNELKENEEQLQREWKCY